MMSDRYQMNFDTPYVDLLSPLSHIRPFATLETLRFPCLLMTPSLRPRPPYLLSTSHRLPDLGAKRSRHVIAESDQRDTPTAHTTPKQKHQMHKPETQIP
jgi:hypothetical protein